MFTEDGILDMDLNFGRYFLEMDAQDVKNGSEFDTIFAITPDPISIGVSGIEEPVDLVLQSLWKVEIDIKDQSFAPAENVTVVFGTEVYDVNSDFASNTFTAPVTGKYSFQTSINLNDLDSGANSVLIEISTSNRFYTLVTTTIIVRLSTSRH